MVDNNKIIDSLESKLRVPCDESLNDYWYSRKVKAINLEFIQSMYAINGSINRSFEYRGGFTKWGETDATP